MRLPWVKPQASLPLFFLHIHKTAGTAVIDSLRPCLGDISFKRHWHPRDILFLDDDSLNQPDLLMAHIGYGITRRFTRPRFCFTFLRHPVERSLSLYYFWKSRPAIPGNPGAIAANTLSLDAFMSLEEPLIAPQIVNVQTWMLFDDCHHYSRTGYANKPDMEILQEAKTNLMSLNFVGFQEDFAQSMRLLAEKVAPLHASQLVLSTKNNNEGRPALSDIPKQTLAKIEALNALDIELYDFARKNTDRFSG